MKPARQVVAGSEVPAVRPPANPLAAPEFTTLRDLRRALARGGLRSPSQRTPEDHARIAAFRTLEELLRLLEDYRRRVEGGQRCRLVEREHPHEPGRLLFEFVIEVEP